MLPFRTPARVLTCLACIFVSSLGENGLFASEATVVAEHVGNKDPSQGDTTQWERVANGKAASEEPVDGPLPAWRVTDSGNAVLFYRYLPTEEQQKMAEDRGWKLSVKCRLNAPASEKPTSSVIAGYTDLKRNRRFYLAINSNSSGEPVIIFDNRGDSSKAPPCTVSGLKASDFHLYELVYDPTSKSASLFVDGARQATDIPSSTMNSKSVSCISWGSADTAGTGAGDFNLVRFEIPSSPQ